MIAWKGHGQNLERAGHPWKGLALGRDTGTARPPCDAALSGQIKPDRWRHATELACRSTHGQILQQVAGRQLTAQQFAVALGCMDGWQGKGRDGGHWAVLNAAENNWQSCKGRAGALNAGSERV